jgi:hexosaminidase
MKPTLLPLSIGIFPSELKEGLKAIRRVHPTRFKEGTASRRVDFSSDRTLDPSALAVDKNGKQITVRYGSITGAFRALGRLLGEATAQEFNADFKETAQLKTIGAMFDVSRNGVIQPEVFKTLLAKMALMGLNMAMLYAEETYEVPGEPFFGYLRGRYTAEELRELDAYAATLGIEMFPCIQTLGHLEQMLQWPAYTERIDVEGVLLAEEKETYQLLEKMIRAASEPFRSKRIHIGMDEAEKIGSGNYLKHNGYKRPFDILNRHLKEVKSICKKQGQRPMIWSDMYFRLGSKTGDYYDKKWEIPDDVVATIPKDVELVYWDYYHDDTKFYEKWIRNHRRLGSQPIVAGGVWTWNRFWAGLPYTIDTTNACMKACKKTKLTEAFVTLWGDDGMECDIISALPGIQYFAEHCYHEQVDEKLLRANFRGSCGASFDSWVRGSDLDTPPHYEAAKNFANPSKWILWDDFFLGIGEPHYPKGLQAHYSKLARDLKQAACKSEADRRLEFPEQVARVLSLKADLRPQLVAAYRKKDRPTLKKLRCSIPKLRKEIERLWKKHREVWLATYKPFGFESIEIRYGGLLTRLDHLDERLRGYLTGKVKNIPEFETKLEKFVSSSSSIPVISYRRVATASVIR